MAAPKKKPTKRAAAPKKAAAKPSAKKPAKKPAQKSAHKSAHKSDDGTPKRRPGQQISKTRTKAKPGDKRKRKGPARGKSRKKGKRLSAAQINLRATVMLTRHIQGWSYEEIAADAGVKVEAARKIVQRRRESFPKLLDRDAVEIIENLALELQLSIADFEAIASAAIEGNNLSVAVAGKARADDAREKLRELLQSVGALPLDLGTMTHIIDIRAVVVEINTSIERFVDAIAAIPMPDDARAAVRAEAKRVSGRLDEIAAAPQNVTPTTNQGDEMDDKKPDDLKEGDRIEEKDIGKGDRLDERVKEAGSPPPRDGEDDGPKAA